jgi:hypothetical protein
MPKEHIFINSHNGVGERLMPKKIFFFISSWWEHVSRQDDDDVHFALTQHAVTRRVAQFGHIILILSQPVFALIP